ncbi:MAG: carboxypeptidase-like regulatory domain-containing protein [Adhaeribacter sp.]
MIPGWYFRLYFFLLFFCGSTSLFAQTNLRLTGTIRHAQTKAPLQSITILKTATGRGTVSDAAGIFRLNVQPNDTLLIRAVGFKTQQYVVHPKAQNDLKIEILLEEGSLTLPEVKVVGGLDYEKVNRALRNMKKPPAPKVVVKPPAPEPLYEEKKTTPVAPSLENPASLLYDMLSKEGKDKRKLEEILAEEAARKKAIEDKKKQAAYDSLFLNRNRDIRR